MASSKKKKRKATPAQLRALAKGRAARKRNLRAQKSAGKKKSARKKPATRSKSASRKPARKTPGGASQGKRAPKLTPQEREGMGLVADLINAQFSSNGNLADCTPFVRNLTDSQRRALLAADRRVRKAAGR